MKDFDRFDKECIDRWRKEAALVPDSKRKQIVAMKKSGESVQKIRLALELPSEQVSIIVIEEFAKERGEIPAFTFDGRDRYWADATDCSA